MTDTEVLRRALDGYGNESLALMLRQGLAPTCREQQRLILNAATRYLALAEGDEAVALRIVETVERLLSNFPSIGNLILGEEFGKVVLVAITEEGE